MAIEAKDELLTLDLKSLLKEITRNWVTIVAIFLVCLLSVFVYSQFLSTPKYSSSATIYAVNQDDTKISTSELAISNYLTKDCCELIMSRTVLEEVISELGLDTTYEGIRNKVTVSNSEDTRFINVKVTTDDPEQARLIADGICEVSKEKIIELLGVDWVKITANANLPQKPSTPSGATYMFYGFAAAVIISAGFVLLSFYRNDKIINAEDVEKSLGICTLAVIPYNRGKSKPYYSKKR